TAGGEVKESAPFALAGKGKHLIRFAGPAPAAGGAPAAPAAPGAPPAAPPPLPELDGPITVEVIDRDAGKSEVLSTREAVADGARRAEYVSIPGVRFGPAGGRNRLTVRLRLKRAVSGPPVTVALGFPPAEDDGATHTTGTLQAKLPPDGKEITL